MKHPGGARQAADVNRGRRHAGILGGILLASLIGTSEAVAQVPALCYLPLTVELPQDVPNARSGGFLSSL